MFGQVLGRDEGFLVAIEILWFCVATGVPCVATWLLGLMQLLGHDIVFPCRDSVLILYRDNVTIEVPCRNQDGHDKRSGVATFVLQHVWPWQGILCSDWAFLCRDIVWSRPRVSCRDRVFLCCDRVWPR